MVFSMSYLLLISYAGGPYGNFAGRDASRGMAKQSFDPGECVHAAVQTVHC